MKKNQAFTLVEMVVVIAVVALLSAIIVPLVAKQVDDAKIAKAKNEMTVIAAAIGQFYKDIGVWPAASSDGTTRVDHALKGLISGTAVDADVAAMSPTAVSYGFTATGNDDWYDAGQTAIDTKLDILDNHLNANNPDGDGSGGGGYATSGEFRWRGPYLPPIGMDPWGHAYMCNILAAYSGSSNMCVILSAGPDGAIDTSYTGGTTFGIASSTAAPTDDDIWVVVHMR